MMNESELRHNIGLAIDALNEIPCNLYKAFKVLHEALGHDYGKADIDRMVYAARDSVGIDEEEPPF